MKNLSNSVIILLFLSCNNFEKVSSVSEITIQDYSFSFPSNYKKIKRETFNSNVGEISNDTLSFNFHFSDHVQQPVKTLAQFFEDEDWKPAVLLDIATKKYVTNIENLLFSKPRTATEKDSTIGKGCDYVVKCRFDNNEFESPIYLPTEMKGIVISIDTVFGHHRETYKSSNPKNGITGIFIKKIPKNKKDSLQSNALSLTTSNLTVKQQSEVLKICSTIKLRESN
jgi:hypothetical protein